MEMLFIRTTGLRRSPIPMNTQIYIGTLFMKVRRNSIEEGNVS